MRTQSLIIRESQLRNVIKNVLLEVQIVDDYLLGKKFSFTEGGEPNFVVIAENISLGQSLIRRYSETYLHYFGQGLLNLSGPGSTGLPYSPRKNLLDKISQEQEGWKLWPKFKGHFESLKSNPGEFFLINKVSSNFKMPTKISTESGQEKFSKFECVLSMTDAVKYIFSYPGSQNFMMAAACTYHYANSWKSLAFAGLLGGSIGAYAGAVAGSTTGAAVTAPAGGVGAAPGGVIGGVVGFLEGAGIGAATVDSVLRVPPLIWALWSGKIEFAAANAFIIALDYMSFGTSKVSAEAVKKAPWLLRGVKGVTQLVFEFVAPMAADASIQVNKDRFTQALQDIINGKYDIKTLLDQSEKELKASIKSQYPDF